VASGYRNGHRSSKQTLTLKNTVIYIPNGTMSADIFKRKMAHVIELKWTFLAFKWAVFLS